MLGEATAQLIQRLRHQDALLGRNVVLQEAVEQNDVLAWQLLELSNLFDDGLTDVQECFELQSLPP